MPFIPVIKVANFQMIFTYNGQRCQNSYHVYNAQGWATGSLEMTCAALKTWWDDYLKARVADSLSLVQIDYRDLTTYDGVAGTYVTGMPDAGTVLGAALPNNVTLAVSWKTARRGRSYRGRTYHLGLVESQVTGNTVESNTLTALTGAYSELVGAIEDLLDQTPGVVSRYSNKLPRAQGVFTAITGCTIDPTVDSQRRRLPGRGT